jgi:hypothetical protein
MKTLRRIGVSVALVAVFTAWLSGACPKGAHAQGCICVVDAVTEKETTITATSVTTGGGAGIYKSNSAYISNLNSTQLSGINTGNFAANFPGWATLPPNSAATAQAVSGLTLTTYASALANAQSQMSELAAESFSGIEQENSSALALLYAVQLNTEVGLEVVNQLRLVRQLLADLVVVEAVNHAEQLNERAREQATNATQFNLGLPP